MGDLYASAVGTMVLQIKEIPPRPTENDGRLCLFDLAEGVDAAKINAALATFGTIESCNVGSPTVVRFASHASALAAKRAAPIAGVCAGADTLYNERSYDGRKDEAGRDDDAGRGWCCFEDGVSSELAVRLRANPRLSAALDALPPKMLALRSGAAAEPITFKAEALEGRVARVVARLQGATFTGKGDKGTVPALYRDYVERVAGALQPLLALGSATTAVQQVLPMPADATGLRAWHLDVMRAQHATIVDALSGKRLDTLTECVAMALEGKDAEGQPLAVRDAAGLSGWLPSLRAGTGTCALLTAGPAAGKTWLLSQLVMQSLGGELLPILVEVQALQKSLVENEAAFAAAADWVDAFLKLTRAPAHYEMLRAARAARQALLLLDGLDEAGKERARVEAHVAEVLAPQGHVLLCTSRPTGLNEELFAGFHRLKLVPLSDAQQGDFLEKRLEPKRAQELAPYLRGMPLDAETRRRVTANPLMLSMIASIAELRTGIDMPTRTAELYSVAADAMLARGGKDGGKGGALPEEEAALLRATFFEAHAAQQRIITEAHLEAAARRVGGSVDGLRARVVDDRLPLLRLLQRAPLQMQAFHLSFQEFYAMRALAEGGARAVPDFRLGDVWWTNAVLMGVQTGDAFGDAFAEAAGLAAGEGGWRARLVAALVREALPAAWLPIVAEAAGAPAELAKLRKFVGRYRDVIQREGGKAVAQLVLQQPEAGVVFDALKEAKMQRLVTWRNKPLADPCVATFAHEGAVVALAVSRSRVVGGAGTAVHVYDAETEELLGKLEGASDVKSVAIFEGEEGQGWIVAGYENGTIKVWDSGASNGHA